MSSPEPASPRKPLPRAWAACSLALLTAPLILNHLGFLGYLRHGPGLDGASSLGALKALALACAFAAGLWGIGSFLLRLIRVEDSPAAFGFGLAAFSLACLFLGLAGILRPWATLPLLAAGGFAALNLRPRAIRLPLPGGPAEAAFAALALWSGFLWLASSLAPPTDFDSLAYHLPLAKRWAETGAIRAVPWMLHSHFPSGFEAAAAAGFHLGDDRIPALLHAACGAAAALALLSLGRRLVPAGAMLPAALFLALPVVSRFAPTAHNDLALALAAVLSCLFLQRWKEGRRTGDLAAAAFLAGSAAGFKYTGLWWGVCICAMFPVLSGARDRRSWALFAAVAAVSAMPWYLRGWVESGNPVWPFLYGLFGGADWTAAAGARYASATSWSLADWPRALLTMVLRPDAADASAWFLLPALLLAALDSGRGIRKAGLLSWLALAGLFLLPVSFHRQAWRMALPTIPILCLAAAASAASLWASRRALAAFAGLCFLPALTFSANNPLFGALAVRSLSRPDAAPREAYLEKTLEMVPAQRWSQANLPEDSRILLFREIRGYYLGREHIWGDPMNQGLLDYEGMAPAALLARMKELGITHVLVNKVLPIYRPDPGYFRPEWDSLMAGTLARSGRRVYWDPAVEVFALDRTNW